MMVRRRLLLLAALLGWVATGCQVTLATGLDVARDGSGQVTAGVGLDADAMKEVGDLSAVLRVDDLRQAGWTVAGPRREGDGLTWVRARKPFTDPAAAVATMAQLSGPSGPFRDFRVTRTRSLLRSRTTFSGVVDLTAGLDGLADPELTQRVGDVDLGLDLAGLRKRFGTDLDETVKVTVSAGLPGEVKAVAASREGRRVLWTPAIGQRLVLQASSEALKVSPTLVAAAVGALLLPVVALVLARRRRRRRR